MKVQCVCQWCKKGFTGRSADVKRGWARFCSKSCKASQQEKLTGQNAAYRAGDAERLRAADMEGIEEGWDAHKDQW